MKRAFVVLAGALLLACPKDKPADVDAGAASTTPAASASIAAAPADAGPLKQAAGASYEGKYTAAPAALYIPSENKDYAGVKQAKDDGTKLVGDGTLALDVDASGRVAGTIDSGPASPAIIEGVVSDGALTGTVRRKEARDDGLTGSIVGTIGADGLEGTMRLADGNAALLREAKFSAKKK